MDNASVSLPKRSRFINIFATTWSKGQTYSNLKVAQVGGSTQPVKANTEVLAVPWTKPGFGCLAVVPLGEFGAQPDNPPLIEAHTGSLADFEFHPFRRDVLATSSFDSPVKIWRLPTTNHEGEEDTDDMTIGLDGTLRDHWSALNHDSFVSKRVHHLSFHPLANDVLLTANADGAMLLWDITHTTAPKVSLTTPSQALSLSWNYAGDLLVALCKDKVLRLVDPRGAGVVASAHEAHPNAEGLKCVWLGNSDYVLTTGFGRGDERELCIWDRRALSGPVRRQWVDTGGLGPLLPFYDSDTGLLYLAGKGDSYMRTYEIVSDEHVARYLGQMHTNSPLSGMIMFPKRVCDVMACELARFLKLSLDRIETVSFHIPKRKRDRNMFDDRTFPDTFSGESSREAAAWFSGMQAVRKMMSLKPEGTISISESRPDDSSKLEHDSDDSSDDSDDDLVDDDESNDASENEDENDENEEMEKEGEHDYIDTDEHSRPRSQVVRREPKSRVPKPDTAQKREQEEHNMQGWLLKQKPGLRKKWDKRWFSLSGGQLYYFHAPGVATYLGSIPLLSVQHVQLAPADVKNIAKDRINCCFLIATPNRSYTLQADTEKLATQWVKALESARVAIHGTKTVNVADPRTKRPAPTIEIYGHLAKKSPGAVGGWKRRWFSLHSEGVLYYAESENSTILGSIDLSVVTSVRDVGTKFGSGKKKDLCFQIDTSNRIYFLQAESKAVRNLWVRRLNTCMQRRRRRSSTKPVPAASGRSRVMPSAGDTLHPVNDGIISKRRSGAAVGKASPVIQLDPDVEQTAAAASNTAPHGLNSSDSQKQGYLLKVSDKGGRRNGWQRRWFVLQGEVIHYYVSHITLKERGRIYLREVAAISPYVEESIDPRGKRMSRRMPHAQKLPGLSYKDEDIFNVFKIEIADRGQTYFLLANSSADRDSWLDSLHAAIRRLNEAEEVYDRNPYVDITDMNNDGEQLFEELEDYPDRAPQGAVTEIIARPQSKEIVNWGKRLKISEIRDDIEQGRSSKLNTEPIAPLVDPTLIRKGRMPILCQCFGSSEGLRYRLVSLSPRSLNKNFVYVLDAGSTIYQWNGTKSNRLERAKALDICMQIKFADGRGAPDTVVLEDGKARSDGSGAQFWALLKEASIASADSHRGSTSDDPLMSAHDESSTDFDSGGKTEMVKTFDSMILFFEVCFAKDPAHCVRLVQSGSRPSRQLLNTRLCYVLDCFSEVFVWIGAQSKGSTRQLALRVARELQKQPNLEGINRPSWTSVMRVSEGREITLFKEKFCDFFNSVLFGLDLLEKERENQTPAIDVAAMCGSVSCDNVDSSSAIARARGTVDVWRLDPSEKKPLKAAVLGQFWSKESYVVVHSYHSHGRDKDILYLWQGRYNPETGSLGDREPTEDESNDVRRTARLWLDFDADFKRKAANAVQLRVLPWKESEHFCNLFPQPIIIHRGRSTKSKMCDTELVCLYELKRTSTSHRPFITDKPVNVLSFDSRNVFLLLVVHADGSSENRAFVWIGAHATEQDRQLLEGATQRIWQGVRTREHVTLPEEPPAILIVQEDTAGDYFWQYVVRGKVAPGKPAPPLPSAAKIKPYYCPSMAVKTLPRLFLCSEALSIIEVEEVFDFSQDDLDDDSVGILDVSTHLYLWFGSKARSYLKKTASQIAQRYIHEAGSSRFGSTPMYVVKEFYEPSDFTCHFPNWKRRYFSNITKFKPQPQPRLALEEVLDEFARVTFPYEVLLGDPLPSGVDPTRLERYLSDDEFFRVLKMTREEFSRLSAEQQDDLKRRVYLA